ncbi:uncharacterized protein LOC119680831 [Teleopsis dalmanni]|uniref:uncharacterized protein LOC119680786 n=1 Tax=Teleopsis dalmanni TaxID=139649 RepID=UPI0018CE50A8|nr:uncharacterized protein LOC119680786 [Teleopsis dalmanni]XP_037949712.1 uncharacterized protein LOC119680795 [Teleopsis dalmanni]XP_037949758.1 uncharacterized protein LOC119680831 [Teleopsis dalmanni]
MKSQSLSKLSKNNNGQNITVGYAIFLHKNELNRRKKNYIRRSASKIKLTDGLISNVKRNIKYCTPDDLVTMSRETIYKKKLDKSVNLRVEYMQQLRKCRKLQQKTPHEENEEKKDK